MGHSVRELKARLKALGVDFSHCCEKVELEQLLEETEAAVTPATATADAGGDEEDFFAVRRADGRRCWVEFVTDNNALCHWCGDTDSIVPAADLEAIPDGALPGPVTFDGSFEDARAAAFHGGRLLVAAVLGDGRQAACKAARLQFLALAGDEVAPLLEENALFWRGRAADLRQQHLQQLAPGGTPSLAMVLPLAADAMRVLSHTPGTSSAAIVEDFVAALERFEEHREAATARLINDASLLRQQQDEEFAAALEADRQRAVAAIEAATEAATEAEASPRPSAEAAKRPPAAEEEEARRTKARRRLADDFLADGVGELSGKARLALRLPGGERVERAFGAEESFARVLSWAECCPLLPEAQGRDLKIPAQFELKLTTAFPPRRLGPDDAEKTLAELGLAPSAVLLLCDTST